MAPPLGLAEAHIKSELLTGKVLPEEFVEHAALVKVNTLAEILEVLFQKYLPSEPIARVDALAQIEAYLKPAKSFAEALRSLRAWKEQLIILVQTLNGRPDTLRLFLAVQPLLQSLFSDSQFAVAHANITAVTNVRTHATPDTLWRYIELLESELNERALEETDRNRRKAQAHGAEVPYAYGMDRKGKDKGTPKGAGGKPPNTFYRNRDDNPNDTRPICPEFLKDRGCNKGGQCTMRHPTRVGKCLRGGAKGHSVSECLRPRRDVPPKDGKGGNPKPKGTPKPPRGGRGRGTGGGRGGNPRTNNSEWLEGADPNQEWEYDADYYEAAEGEDDYEEGTTVPSGVTIEDVTDQPSAGAAYVIPGYSPTPSAMLTARESTPLTPILDTGASHCLLPVTHLTKEEAELATRVHLRVANGSMTRALMYQNIIYARKVPRTSRWD
eukprot:5228263-Amphidinium_carterae.2